MLTSPQTPLAVECNQYDYGIDLEKRTPPWSLQYVRTGSFFSVFQCYLRMSY